MFALAQINPTLILICDKLPQPLELTASEALQLHQLLGDALHQQEMISTEEAHALATAQGFTIPQTTLINACVRGTITDAMKNGTRWQMPRESFLRWFNRWKTKQST